MTYQELNKSAEDRISALPIVWGFSDQQIRDNAKAKGIEVTDLRAIGAGGYVSIHHRKVVAQAFSLNMKERDLWLLDMKNLEEAFLYELGNHEFCITYDDQAVWEAVGVSLEDHTVEQMDAYLAARRVYLSQEH